MGAGANSAPHLGRQALGEVIDHLGEGERHHDELEAARAQRERSDRQCEQHRHQNGERPRHEGVGEAIDRQHARGVGADAKQRRLSEGHQPMSPGGLSCGERIWSFDTPCGDGAELCTAMRILRENHVAAEHRNQHGFRRL